MAGEAPIPVSMVASTALSPTAYGVFGLLFMAFVAIVKAWPVLTKLRNESDASLRGDLLKRIATLEHEVAEERRKCDEQLADMRHQMEGIHRQLIAFQLSSGRAMHLDTSETDKAMTRLADMATDKLNKNGNGK